MTAFISQSYLFTKLESLLLLYKLYYKPIRNSQKWKFGIRRNENNNKMSNRFSMSGILTFLWKYNTPAHHHVLPVLKKKHFFFKLFSSWPLFYLISTTYTGKHFFFLFYFKQKSKFRRFNFQLNSIELSSTKQNVYLYNIFLSNIFGCYQHANVCDIEKVR